MRLRIALVALLAAAALAGPALPAHAATVCNLITDRSGDDRTGATVRVTLPLAPL